jgi:hypothetical protein
MDVPGIIEERERKNEAERKRKEEDGPSPREIRGGGIWCSHPEKG